MIDETKIMQYADGTLPIEEHEEVKKAIEIYKEIVESDDVDFKDDALADLKRLNADEDNNNSNVSNTPRSKKRSSKDSIDAVSSKKQKK